MKAEKKNEITIDKKGDATWYDESSESQKAKAVEIAKEKIKGVIKKEADNKEKELQKEISDELSCKLEEVKPTIDKVINKVTRDALKRKASQMGEIKELSEDDKTGNLIIKVEL